MLIIMMEFKDYYGLFNIYGAIDGTHSWSLNLTEPLYDIIVAKKMVPI
jgi:hypothetical protein